jgi:hypothetical protein
MMRFGRRTSSLVAFCLLASAATACAECAWMFWQQDETVALFGGGSSKWATPIAYADRAGCVAVIDRYVKAWEEGRSPTQTVDRMPSGTAAEFRTQRGPDFWAVVRRYCLPDTVDPRGPKGAPR